MSPSAPTSPFKPTDHRPQNRRELSESFYRSGMLTTSDTFEKDHFPADTDSLKDLKSIATDSQAAKHIDEYLEQHKARQVEEYEYPLQILNRLNDLVHEKYCSSAKKLKFIDHHKYTIPHHPNDFSGSPDFYCGEKPIVQTYDERQMAVPWHYSDSVFELKKKKTHEGGLKQAGAYAGMLNQARPDKPGVYVGYMSPEGYQIIWSDPSGLYISDQYPLTNLLPLTKYIYCLYRPVVGHIPRDTTITLANPGVHKERPLWNVQFAGVTYENCAVKTVGRPWTRMTWVAIPQGQPEIIIKDTYVREDGRIKEGDYYNILQRDGPAPGWVHMQTWGEVKNGDDVIVTPVKSRRARKFRLIMGTTGESLHRCKSVFEFLKAMYDILESHRWAVLKRRVLHRDVSYSNILIHPKGTYMPAVSEDDSRPKFADEILFGKKNAPPAALLYDLDHATLLEGAEVSQQYIKQEATCRRERTGTPMYASRAVCKGTVLDYALFVPMPPVSSEYSASYYAIHAGDPIRQFHDTPGTCHGGIPDPDWRNVFSSHDGPVSLFHHEPRHDAESIYWVMVAFVLRALPLPNKKPLGNQKEPDNATEPSDEGHPNDDDELSDEEDSINESEPITDNSRHVRLTNIWKQFSAHCIPTVENGVVLGQTDVRENFFFTHYEWILSLHPRLEGIAHMMRSLGDQVRPEYTFIKPRLNEVHLHEAMQRIILAQLWTMKDGDHIKLNRRRLRPVLENIDDSSPRLQDRPNHDGRGTGSKRKVRDQEVVTRPSKRARNAFTSTLASIPDQEESVA